MIFREIHRRIKLNSIAGWFRSLEIGPGIIFAIAIGAVAGFGAIGFRWLITSCQLLFFGGGEQILNFLGPYYTILLPASGGLLVGILVYFGAREAKGHGVPEVMEAVAIRGGRIRPRVAVVKALASSICIGSGGSVGREGPIVQIGSAFGSTIGQWTKLPAAAIKTLVLCGAAGGISATFNAPIGGAFFAMEVIQGRIVARNLAPVIVSSVTANIVALRFLGNSPPFSITPYQMFSNWEILPYTGLGVVAAFIALAFMYTLYKWEDIFQAFKFPEYLKPALGGILIGLLGLYSLDLFGVGYGQTYWESHRSVDQALTGGLALDVLVIMLVLKILAVSITIGSGGSGGIFAPSLFMGAMLGGAFGRIIYTIWPAITAPTITEASGAYALVGMAAVFSGVARAPITSIIMLFEMTRDYALILPLMAAVVASTLITRWLNRETIYTLKLRRRGIDIQHRQEADALRRLTVAEAMTPDFPTVLSTMPVPALIEEIHQSGHHGFPVVDKLGHFYGVVTLEDIESAMGEKDFDLTVGDITTKSPIVAYPDQSIYEALAQFGGRDVGRIPVVNRNNPKELLGVLRRHDIIRAYVKALKRKD